jgi:hypothetical protein
MDKHTSSKVMAVVTMLLILTMIGCLSNNTFAAYAPGKFMKGHGPSISGSKPKPLTLPHEPHPKPLTLPHEPHPMPRDQLNKISQDISQSHKINFNQLMDFAGLQSSKFLLGLLYAGR